MTKAVRCDRCGIFSTDTHTGRSFTKDSFIAQISMGWKHTKHIDICDGCLKLLIDTIKSWWEVHVDK